jgi:acyl dehydratase
MIEIADVEALRQSLGRELAVSGWLEVTQERIDQFAGAIDDHQWIHVDPARAKESAFKGTIAHGFLTLSLISALLREATTFTSVRMALNYGVNRVRFVAAVPSGSRIRGRFAPTAIDARDEWFQVTWAATIEREGAEKPVCVAEWIVRYYV